MTLALVILFGCAKEETTTAIADNQQVDESSVYVLNASGDSPTWEVISLDELPSTQSSSGSATNRDNNGNSVHTHGSLGPNSQPFVWSGTENNGGPHGSAYLEFGPGQITMVTECIRVEGNEAVYGGTITEFVNPFGPFDVGWHIYIKVIDNGQGNNAPPDQANGVYALMDPSSSGCDIFTPSHPVYNIFPDYEIQEPGKVKVNN